MPLISSSVIRRQQIGLVFVDGAPEESDRYGRQVASWEQVTELLHLVCPISQNLIRNKGSGNDDGRAFTRADARAIRSEQNFIHVTDDSFLGLSIVRLLLLRDCRWIWYNRVSRSMLCLSRVNNVLSLSIYIYKRPGSRHQI